MVRVLSAERLGVLKRFSDYMGKHPLHTWAAPGDPVEDLRSFVAELNEQSLQPLQPQQVTRAMVERVQDYMRSRGYKVPEVKDGKFLGKVVVKL